MDKLTQLYDEWVANNPDHTFFQAFQAGLTIGAVSMRGRAMAAVDKEAPDPNGIKNAIGALADIPE